MDYILVTQAIFVCFIWLLIGAVTLGYQDEPEGSLLKWVKSCPFGIWFALSIWPIIWLMLYLQKKRWQQLIASQPIGIDSENALRNLLKVQRYLDDAATSYRVLTNEQLVTHANLLGSASKEIAKAFILFQEALCALKHFQAELKRAREQNF